MNVDNYWLSWAWPYGRIKKIRWNIASEYLEFIMRTGKNKRYIVKNVSRQDYINAKERPMEQFVAYKIKERILGGDK